jgi:tRNA (guanine-N7-)-methyltransferase
MSDPLDPRDFIITRKRKKYRFAKFHNASNCMELDEWVRRPVDVIEIGAGTALFSVELASRHPDLTFLALDIKADRLQKGAHEALARGLDNVWFVRARADQVERLVDAGSVREVWVTFPDPFPKRRSAGRRLTHPTFLAHYAHLLTEGGTFNLKHDNREFFAWSLEQLVGTGWRVLELSFDLHESELTDDYKVMTSYEQRWLDEGLTTQFVRAYAPLAMARASSN